MCGCVDVCVCRDSPITGKVNEVNKIIIINIIIINSSVVVFYLTKCSKESENKMKRVG